MKDQYGREVDYLRISITDRCNFRCRYCMPEGIEMVSMADILTFEEILSVVKAAVKLGIRKFKVTGGEPLVRRGCVELIRQMKEIPGVAQVTMTTNGKLLSKNIEALKAAGLDAVNVSLDTLQPERFSVITGMDALDEVLEGIHASCDAGIRTKVNAVLQRDKNMDEWQSLLLLSKDLPLDVRFIELMPIGFGEPALGINNEVLKGWIREAYPNVEEDRRVHGNGPASYWYIPGFRGSIGFISAMHGKFCADCNRIRMTSQGKIKPCLCYGETGDVRRVLRSCQEELLEEALMQELAGAIGGKPKAHCFENEKEITEKHRMSAIGG